MLTIEQIRAEAPPLEETQQRVVYELKRPSSSAEDQERWMGIYDFTRCVIHRDFRYFTERIMGINTQPGIPPHPKTWIDWDCPHGEVADMLMNPPSAPDGGHYLLLLMPRDSFKSILAMSRELLAICEQPTQAALWTGSSYKKVQKKEYSLIKNSFETNKKLKWMLAADPRYPELKGEWKCKGSWSDDGFHVMPGWGKTREHTLAPAAAEMSTTGKHFHRMVLDDLVDLESIRTEGGLDRTKQYYMDLTSQLSPGGTMLVIGTRWHHEDIYAHVMGEEIEIQDRKTKKFTSITYSIYKEGHDDDPRYLVFPHLDEAAIAVKRAACGGSIARFTSQYKNKIISEEFQIFHIDQFKQFQMPKDADKRRDFLDSLNIYMLTDIAESTGARADLTVLMVVGLDCDGMAYVLDVVSGQFNSATVADKFYILRDKWNPMYVLVEKVVGTDKFRTILDQKAQADGLNQLPIFEVMGRSKQRKFNRIEGLTQRFASGQIQWSDELDKNIIEFKDGVAHKELVMQFISFSDISTGRDDYPDCLSDIDVMNKGMRICHYPAKPTEVEVPKHVREMYDSVGIDPITKQRQGVSHDMERNKRKYVKNTWRGFWND